MRWCIDYRENKLIRHQYEFGRKLQLLINVVVPAKHRNTSCLNSQTIIVRTQTLFDFLHFPLKTLLFGDPRLADDKNERIEAVHNYIIQTRRFDFH